MNRINLFPYRWSAYLILGVAVAIFTPSPDMMTLLACWLAGVVVFEIGYFAYRRL
jgi:Sec-independent protein secretion pathway component TatC